MSTSGFKLPRRGVLLAASTLPLAGLASCASGSQTASSSPSSSPASSAASSPTSAAAASASPSISYGDTVATVDELIAQAQSKFSQVSYDDAESGKSIVFNLFLPENYSDQGSYPLVVFIPDASLVGKQTSDYLSVYGALVWAGDEQQQIEPSIVVVPQYDEVIIDDNNNALTKTDYIEATGRLVTWLQEQYAVDRNRVYGTGQSMGCMTTMYLAAQHPDLYTAVLLVSGQWVTSELAGLSEGTWTYLAAAGDAKASQGQNDVKAMLDAAGTPYALATTEWDAAAAMAEQNKAAEELYAQGQPRNIASFVAGSVLTANPAETHEHMASFEVAYRIPAVRAWLLSQSK